MTAFYAPGGKINIIPRTCIPASSNSVNGYLLCVTVAKASITSHGMGMSSQGKYSLSRVYLSN